MPHDLINAKPVMASSASSSGRSQLSQFMDQTNPLSEITHKRRLSALGPGGLSRERAGFEVRDVHPTHYGRICPIETPEGPNIGLISSLSCFARINEFGFIESPYRKVKGGQVLDYYQVLDAGSSPTRSGDIVEKDEMERENSRGQGRKKKPAEIEPYCFYLSAWEEDKYTIAQANIKLGEDGDDRRGARLRAQDRQLHPGQARRGRLRRRLAEAAGLGGGVAHPVPGERRREPRAHGLQHAAPGRAAAPVRGALVGTGMEHITVKDSGAAVVCRRAGVVDSVDSRRIIIRVEAQDGPDKGKEIGADIYNLTKFKCSNQNTSINQKPIVKAGQHVEQGPDPGRRSLHGHGRAGPRPQRARGLHALARLQLRGRDPGQREAGQGGHVHLDPHRGVRDRGPRHQARARGSHPRHPQRLGIAPQQPRRERDHPDRRLREARATSWWARSRPRARPSSPPKRSCCARSSARRRATCATRAWSARPASRASWSTSRSSRGRASRRTTARKQIEDAELFMMEKNLKDEIRILQDERDKRIEDLLDGKTVVTELVNAAGRQGHQEGPAAHP